MNTWPPVFNYLSNIKVLREKLIHNHNCLLVDEYENVNDWSMSIKKLKDDIAVRKKISFNAIKTASKNTWRIRVKKIIKIHKKFYS